MSSARFDPLECAVHECTSPATMPIVVHGVPVAQVCDHHDQIGNMQGYVLRIGLGILPVIYPPGVEIPPF